MICTGSIMAVFEIPILFLGILIGVIVGDNYGMLPGMIIGATLSIGGLMLFHKWWFGEWVFVRKAKQKEVNQDE